MDIEDIKKEKRLLEDTIFKLLTTFCKETGMSPTAVHLDMITVANQGEDYHYHLHNVRVDAAV